MSAVARLLRSHATAREPLRVLAASGQLGYGIPEAAFRAGLARRPHFIGADMGSIDPGPAYLGAGQMATTVTLTRRDLELVLVAARELDVPLIIGSAGTAGAAPHLQATLALVREIAREHRLRFRLATVRSDLRPERVCEAWRGGHLQPIGAMPALTEAAIRSCTHIVGQCGTETLRRALALEPDVIIAGRACDTAIFAAIPELLGYDAALALHMAKIIECTSLCCEPGGRDAMLATLDDTGFVLESMHPDRRATPQSVAAHALYEQDDPTRFAEPMGVVNLDGARYVAVDARRVRVSGARWQAAPAPSVKVEGAQRVGVRAVLLAGSADPAFIAALDVILPAVETNVRRLVPGAWTVHPRVYGRDGVVAWTDPPAAAPREVMLLVECIAPDAELARTALTAFKQALLHHGFPGRIATAGNVAFAFTPPEIDCGPAFRFVLYHIMHDADPAALFEVATEQIEA